MVPFAVRFPNATFDPSIHSTGEFNDFFEDVLSQALDAQDVAIESVRSGSVIVEAKVRTNRDLKSEREDLLLKISDLTTEEGALNRYHLGRAEALPIDEDETSSDVAFRQALLSALPFIGAVAAVILAVLGTMQCCRANKSAAGPRKEGSMSLPFRGFSTNSDKETYESRGTTDCKDDEIKLVITSIALTLDIIEEQVLEASSVLVRPVKHGVQGIVVGTLGVLARRKEVVQHPELLNRLDSLLVDIADKLGLVLTINIDRPVDDCDAILRDLVRGRSACTSLLSRVHYTEHTLDQLGEPIILKNPKSTKAELDLAFAESIRSLLREKENGDFDATRSIGSSGASTGMSTSSESGRGSLLDFSTLLRSTTGYEKVLSVETLLSTTGMSKRVEEALDLLSQAVLHDSPGSYRQIPFEELSMDELIGNGAFGMVIRGKHLDKPVAVKLLADAEQDGLSLHVMETFISELERWQSLDHPNIVKLLGTSIDKVKDRACFVMELCDTSLATYLHDEKNPVDMDVFGRIVADISTALIYVHRRGIVHRDIKPANILLNTDLDGTVLAAKLCDFGMSTAKSTTKILSRDEEDELPCGTPAFMAPEQLSIPVVLSSKTDIYSFAVVMWEIAEQREAWLGVNDVQLLCTKVTQGERPPFSERSEVLPPGAQTLIEDCWHHHRNRRPGALEVYHRILALSPKLEARREDTSPRRAKSRTKKPGRRSKSLSRKRPSRKSTSKNSYRSTRAASLGNNLGNALQAVRKSTRTSNQTTRTTQGSEMTLI